MGEVTEEYFHNNNLTAKLPLLAPSLRQQLGLVFVSYRNTILNQLARAFFFGLFSKRR